MQTIGSFTGVAGRFLISLAVEVPEGQSGVLHYRIFDRRDRFDEFTSADQGFWSVSPVIDASTAATMSR